MNPYPEFINDGAWNEPVPDARHKAFQQGRREVVEWIKSHQDGMQAGQDIQDAAGNNCKYGNTSHLLVRWLDWQSQLKEWALEG